MATSYKTVGQQAYEQGKELEKIIETAKTICSPQDMEWAKAYQWISEKKSADAVLAFRLTLEAVKQVFGEENLTVEVMNKAIEAGSYIGWRAVMGEAANTVIKRY